MLLSFFLRLCKLSALVKATIYNYDNAKAVIEGDELSRTNADSKILCALYCEKTNGCEKLVWMGGVNRTCIAYRDSLNKHNLLPGAIEMAITKVCYVLLYLDPGYLLKLFQSLGRFSLRLQVKTMRFFQLYHTIKL